MAPTKHGRAKRSADDDGSSLAPPRAGQAIRHTPELRLVCSSWRRFMSLQDELNECDALSLPLSDGLDGEISLTIETPDGEVLHVPAFLAGGVVDKSGMPESLIVRVAMDDALRERLARHTAQGNALVQDDVEAISRLRGDSIGAYHVSAVSKRRKHRGDSEAMDASATHEPPTPQGAESERDSRRPTAPVPAKKPSKRPDR
jgi:hypothetical protein